MINKFTFQPVGQGLFYTGQLGCDYFYLRDSRYNFIFDCGSLSGDNSLHSSIDNFLVSLHGQDIDLCVISHLHIDHYNGLEFLLRNTNVKKILLPYLPDNKMVRFAVLAGQFIDANKKKIEEDENSILNLKILANLYGIDERKYIDGHRPYVIFCEEKLEYQSDNGTQNFRSRVKDGCIEIYWGIECYNKTLSNEKWQYLSEKIIALLKEEGFEEISEMLNYDTSSLHKIAEIYSKVFKQQNTTSIVIKHYPVLDSVGIYPNHPCKLPLYLPYKKMWYYDNYVELFGKRNKNISVLTGDIEFDESLRKVVFNDFRGINVLQLPHHGSAKNWKLLKLPKLFSGKCIASFGLGNRYCHPGIETINGLKEYMDADLIEVNQNSRYEYLILD